MAKGPPGKLILHLKRKREKQGTKNILGLVRRFSSKDAKATASLVLSQSAAAQGYQQNINRKLLVLH